MLAFQSIMTWLKCVKNEKSLKASIQNTVEIPENYPVQFK